MELMQAVAGGMIDFLLFAPNLETTSTEKHARDALAKATPTGWLVKFPNGTVFIDNEPLMRINLANGYAVTPLYAGEPL